MLSFQPRFVLMCVLAALCFFGGSGELAQAAVPAAVQQDDASVRKWTDSTGKFSVVAELVEVVGDKVKLKKQNGKETTLPLAKLSDADRRYLETVISSDPERSASDLLATSAKFERSLKPFLKKYCIRCHNADEQSGGARFDLDNWEIKDDVEAQHWQDMLDVLNGAEMPPADERQPSAHSLTRVLDLLTSTLDKARQRLNDQGGEVAMRRLNRREYSETIKSLFGFSVNPGLLPADAGAGEFDTIGYDQFFTAPHFDKYMDVGRKVASLGFKFSGKPQQATKKMRLQPEVARNKEVRATSAAAKTAIAKKQKLVKAGKSPKGAGFKKKGDYEKFLKLKSNVIKNAEKYLQRPQADAGSYLLDNKISVKRGAITTDPRAYYKVKIRAGVVGSPPEKRRFVSISNGPDVIAVLRVEGTPSEPEIIETRLQMEMGQSSVVTISENRSAVKRDEYIKQVDPRGESSSIWIDWVEIEGPFLDGHSSAAVELPTARNKAAQRQQDQDARKLIESFAFEAFRRVKPDPKYLDALVDLYSINRRVGKNSQEAFGEVFAVILSSPRFLFINERDTGGTRELLPRELAIRLSYFLWSAPPDEELYRCAKNRSILKPEVLVEQAERLLNDPKADMFFEGFAKQWALLERFDSVSVDTTDFILFNSGIRMAAKREVISFFKTLFRENLPVSNLIDSDFLVVNSLLADYYDIEGVDSNTMVKVPLPSDSPRGGLLGQVAFLTMGSTGEKSSPVIRGALVMEKLLHDKPASPPPNVPELAEASKVPLTNRMMVELHQKQPQCASCHQKMDVIGFGLENYDAIGKWRSKEQVGKKMVPISPGGKLPGGRKFRDIDGLKHQLLQEEKHLAKGMVESLLSYGLGRQIEFSDRDAVDRIHANLEPNKYSMRSMIQEIVASEMFKRN